MLFQPSHDQIQFGIIGIHRHQVSCIVGILPQERVEKQTLFIDLKIRTDLSKCIQSGQLSDSIDYTILAHLCTKLAEEKNYYLIENFAADVIDQCFSQFQPTWAWIKIQKPSAIPTAEYAFVECERYHLG